MGCRTLTDITQHDYTCFYDSVTMTAFGPVMSSEEEAEAFRRWLEADARRWAMRQPYAIRGKIIQGELSCDPRSYPELQLRNLYVQFRKGWNEDTQEHLDLNFDEDGNRITA